MRNSLILLFVLVLSAIFVSSVFSQSGYAWEMVCESGKIEVNTLEDGTLKVSCLYLPVVETPTDTATPTETLIPTETPTPTVTPTRLPPSNGIVVDHNSIALFDQIPQEYLDAARDIPMVFSDRSVGVNMNEALNCLSATSWETSLSYCRRDYIDENQTAFKTFTKVDLANGTVPELIQFTGGHDRSNWYYTECSGDYDYMVDFFINTLAPNYLPITDVLSCQYSYLNVDNGSEIMNYFIDSEDYDVYDLEEFIAQHPDKEFVFWTTSLARTIGTEISTNFNNQMREYAIENGKVLMDMADITSHDRYGNECLDSTGRYPVICRDYTTELSGGHLGSVSGGKIQMAKAFWVLMAQIAGWRP